MLYEVITVGAVSIRTVALPTTVRQSLAQGFEVASNELGTEIIGGGIMRALLPSVCAQQSRGAGTDGVETVNQTDTVAPAGALVVKKIRLSVLIAGIEQHLGLIGGIPGGVKGGIAVAGGILGTSIHSEDHIGTNIGDLDRAIDIRTDRKRGSYP